MKRLASFAGMAPAVGPFSQAVVAGGFVFTTGQIPLISGTDDQAGRLRRIVSGRSSATWRPYCSEPARSLEHVVNITTYLSDPDQFEEYDRIFAEVIRRPAARPDFRLRGYLGLHFRNPMHRSLKDEHGVGA